MGVKAGCKPRGDVLQGELDDAIFAASFDKLTRGEGPLIYRDPALFFQNTHPTAALSKLCRDVFGRMASSTDSGAVLRLSTGFGGGKTHALMTLWHLAKTIADPTMGTDLLSPAGRPVAVRVVGIDAEGSGYPVFARHGDQEARSLAAELAFQLGGASALNTLGSANATAASPDAATVEALLPNEPVLILLDELVLYMAKLSEVGPNADADWNEQVTLEIGPHPELSDSQQKVIALDYGMLGGRARISVRRALLYYALKRLGLDTDPGARRPQDQQIVLLNREAVTGGGHLALGAHG